MIIKLSITNWEKYNPRRDIKRPSWFAMSNQMLRDPTMDGMSSDDIIVWIHCLSLASEQCDKNIVLDTKYLTVYRGCAESVQMCAIRKLCKIGFLTQIRTRHVRNPYATQQDRTEQDNPLPPSGDSPVAEDLLKTWNENRGSLPGAIGISAARRRAAKVVLAEEPDMGVWGAVVTRIANSNFCTGTNDRGWRATFDWLLKPDTRMKVLEGKFDTRDPKREAWEAKQREEAQLAELAKSWGINAD